MNIHTNDMSESDRELLGRLCNGYDPDEPLTIVVWKMVQCSDGVLFDEFEHKGDVKFSPNVSIAAICSETFEGTILVYQYLDALGLNPNTEEGRANMARLPKAPKDVCWFVASVDARAVSRPRSRTWGFWRTYEDAEAYVQENVYLLSESNYYTHAVIESVECGVGHLGGEREGFWFKLEVADRKRSEGVPQDTATPCAKPEHLKHVVNFTLG
jgi:hypothetical protein